MKWRFLNTGFNNAAYNMAVDEAIMQFVAEGISPPTLRFYGWTPSAISLGYFQSAERDVAVENCRAQGVDIVRRITGGRAILHDKELTYSIVLPENYPGIPKTVTESYKMLSQGLLAGFVQLGLDARLAPLHKGKLGGFSSGACFDAPSSYELVINDKKIVGSAQVRQHGVILQHGSIVNELEIDKLFDCLTFKRKDIRERAEQIFSQKATSIKDVKGKTVSWETLCNAFYQGFKQGLTIELEPGKLSDEELGLVRQLSEKYRSEQWNFKK